MENCIARKVLIEFSFHTRFKVWGVGLRIQGVVFWDHTGLRTDTPAFYYPLPHIHSGGLIHTGGVLRTTTLWGAQFVQERADQIPVALCAMFEVCRHVHMVATLCLCLCLCLCLYLCLSLSVCVCLGPSLSGAVFLSLCLSLSLSPVES